MGIAIDTPGERLGVLSRFVIIDPLAFSFSSSTKVVCENILVS
jgi:hypothetical protein